MELIDTSSGDLVEAIILDIESKDFQKIKKGKGFVFDWSVEEKYDVYKICLKGEETKILDLLSLIDHSADIKNFTGLLNGFFKIRL